MKRAVGLSAKRQEEKGEEKPFVDVYNLLSLTVKHSLDRN
jgi:hypothetical protein